MIETIILVEDNYLILNIYPLLSIILVTMAQVQRICFTFIASIWADGKLSDEANSLLSWLEEHSKFTRIGVERAPTTGKMHWQGYAELAKRWRITQLIKLRFGWHVEQCKGNQGENLAYCSKDGNYVDHGKLVEQQPGKRSDLDRVRSVLSSSGLRGVVAAGASYQAIKYAEKVVTYNETKRSWKPLVLYIQGEPGWGKSTLASDIAEYLFPGSDNKYTKSSNSKWFDGYDAHPVCILDDWRDSWWPLTEALGLIDRNECRVECKGGSRQFLARVIIMTSVRDFPTVYEKVKAEGEPAFQFRRRFDRVITLTNEYRASTKKLCAVREVAGNTRAATSCTSEPPTYEELLVLADSFICSRFCARTYDPKVCLQPERSDRVKYTHFDVGDHSPDGPAPSMLTEDTIRQNVGTRIDEWSEDEFVYYDD